VLKHCSVSFIKAGIILGIKVEGERLEVVFSVRS